MNEVMHEGDIQHLAGHHGMIRHGSPVFTMQHCNIAINNNILLIINNECCALQKQASAHSDNTESCGQVAWDRPSLLSLFVIFLSPSRQELVSTLKQAVTAAFYVLSNSSFSILSCSANIS
jgi:hypothetical protein